MKKVWILGLVLLASMSLLMAACGDDDEDGTGGGGLGESCRGAAPVVCDPACDPMTEWCNEGVCEPFPTCDPACAEGEWCAGENDCQPIPDEGDVEEVELCDEGLTCDIDTWTCVEDAAATCDPACEEGFECVDGECVEAVAECDPACAEGETCVDGVCVADEPTACLDAECGGILMCDNGDGEAGECTDNPVVVCIEGAYNQDCAGEFEMNTAYFGECAEIDCTEDADCEGLASCDDPEMAERAPMCDTEAGKCAMELVE